MKSLTSQQVERRKAQAVRFTRDVREDDDRADEIEDESLQDYADDRHIKLSNPKGSRKMAVPTRRELQDRIQELEAANEDLQSRLDEISDIVSTNDGDDDTDENSDADDLDTDDADYGDEEEDDQGEE
jgi:hypothetical protein